MKNSHRNSLILLTTLLILVGAAWGYFKVVQYPKMAKMQQVLEEKRAHLERLQLLARQYQDVRDQFQSVHRDYLWHPKLLFPSSAQSLIYKFVDNLGKGDAEVRYDLDYLSTETYTEFGIVKTSISGTGNFRHLYRFIARLERNSPLNKIAYVQISHHKDLQNRGEVKFNLELWSYFHHRPALSDPGNAYFARAQNIYLNHSPSASREPEPRLFVKKGMPLTRESSREGWSVIQAHNTSGWVPSDLITREEYDIPYIDKAADVRIHHNAFRPLIYELPPNTENLVDIAHSRLVGLTENRIYIRDQDDQLTVLKPGDQVYSGWLSRIDQSQGRASFTLDRGGVFETVHFTISHSSPAGSPPLSLR